MQAVVESTPPSLRRATAPFGAPKTPEPISQIAPVAEVDLPPVLAKIPGIQSELLTEADLLLADPATHTHPLGSHSLLPIHPGYDQPHSHPPFNQHPVLDPLTGEILSHPPPELLQLHPQHHPVHAVHPTPKPVDEGVNSVHAIAPHHPDVHSYHHPKPVHPPAAHYPAPHHHPTPLPHHPTPVPHHPTPVPHHPSPVPHHPTPVPHHPSPVPHHPTPVPHHPTPVPHHPHPTAAYHHPAPVPLGYQKHVPVKYHELHAAVPHHAAAPYSPYVAPYGGHYAPHAAPHHRPYGGRYFAQL